MSQWYNPKKTTGLYDPSDLKPFKISRSRIEAFLKCPRCFYIDRKFGIGQPPSFPFNLNSAVDKLLKQEFDVCRYNDKEHPLLKAYKVDAVPAKHESLNDWRNTLKGIGFHHKPTNFWVYGGIDDLWQNSKGEYIVVDYKATSKFGEIKELNADWQDGYKRQVEIYQWIFRQNGMPISNTAYFVYCNGKTDDFVNGQSHPRMFNRRLEFDVTLIPYEGNDSWVEKAVFDIKKCLDSNQIPEANPACDYCTYIQTIKVHHEEL